MLDEKQLRYFMKLYEVRSMHKAAEELYISQQGLSKSIQSLESDLRVKLFRRSVSGVIPTESGDYFYEESRHLLNSYMQARKNARLLAGGRVQLSFPFAVSQMRMMYPLCQEFNDTHEDIRLAWEALPDQECEHRILINKAFFAVLAKGDTPDTFDFREVGKDRMAVIPGKDLKDVQKLTLRNLDGKKIILHAGMQYMNRRFRTLCLEEGIHPQILATTGDYGFARYLHQEEGASILIPEHYRNEEKVIPVSGAQGELPVVMIRKKGFSPKDVYHTVEQWFFRKFDAMK